MSLRLISALFACAVASATGSSGPAESDAPPCDGESTGIGAEGEGDDFSTLQTNKHNHAPWHERPVTASSVASQIRGMASLGTPGADRCAWVSYEAKYSLPSLAEAEGFVPPMELGTDANMDPRLKELGLDLTGIWWMRGNGIPEELTTFAGTFINSSTYPFLLSSFTTRARHRSMHFSISMIEFSRFDVNWLMNRTMYNSTYGEIVPNGPGIDSWPFQKIDDDQWLRPTNFKKGTLPDMLLHGDSVDYTFTRVVKGDGTPHPKYWPAFLETQRSRFGPPGSGTLFSTYNNNVCERSCGIYTTCSICKLLCGLKSRTA